jgi:hypothetical protein
MREAARLATLRHPRIIRIDARHWVAKASSEAGRSVGLGDVPERDIERIAGLGFDVVWLSASWTIGAQSRRLWRGTPWMQERRALLLPDLTDDEIVGSPLALGAYAPPRELGHDAGLRGLRRRLEAAGIGLILDFVPNQTANDHPWVRQHPDWYVQVDASDRAADPDCSFEVRAEGRHWIAHGRDPNFPPWRDTAQLDYRHPELRRAMIRQLRDIATMCDGVVCHLAMLALDDVFRSTWDGRSVSPTTSDDASLYGEFWWHAITAVREAYPHFLIVAQAYWGTEWRLQRLGFDLTFDKVLRDRLLAGDPGSVVAHLRADEEFQRRSVRYLDDEGEPPFASLVGWARLRASLLTTAIVPGALLVSDAELEGSLARVPAPLGRRPDGPNDEAISRIYETVLTATDDETFRRGQAIRIDPQSAWPGNQSHESILARLWTGPHRQLRLAVANLGPDPAQGYVPLPLSEFGGRTVNLQDLLADITYVRAGDDLLAAGLYLDLPGHGCHLFRITRETPPSGRRRRQGVA